MHDPKIEQALADGGIQYDYLEEVAVSQIEIDPGALNNIRLGEALKPEALVRYQVALDTGAVFPALVLYRHKKGFRIIDGMHRTSVYKRGQTQVTDAYVCCLTEADDGRVINLLQRTLNKLHGEGLPLAERIEQARYLHQQMGYTIADAARLQLLKAGTLARAIKIAGVREETVAVFGDEPSIAAAILHHKSGLPDTALLELRRITDDDIFRDACRLAHTARLGAAAVKEFSREVREARTQSQRLAVVEAWRVRHQKDVQLTVSGNVSHPTSALRSAFVRQAQVQRYFANDQKLGALTGQELAQAIQDTQEIVKWARKTVTKLQRLQRKILRAVA